jgi:molybdenum cofactor cytidylyltransferase
MPPDAVAGVLLAAGTSSRMGRNKLMLDLDGETVVRGCARRALAGGVSPLIVVVGAGATQIRSQLSDLPCEIVTNTGYMSGMTSSMRRGVESVPETAAAAIILLADMPRVTSEMISQIIQRYRETRALLVTSGYEGVSAPPILYDRRLLDELKATTDGSRGRDVVAKHRAEAETLRWPASALADLDVPADYLRLITI